MKNQIKKLNKSALIAPLFLLFACAHESSANQNPITDGNLTSGQQPAVVKSTALADSQTPNTPEVIIEKSSNTTYSYQDMEEQTEAPANIMWLQTYLTALYNADGKAVGLLRDPGPHKIYQTKDDQVSLDPQGQTWVRAAVLAPEPPKADMLKPEHTPLKPPCNRIDPNDLLTHEPPYQLKCD